MHPFLQLIDTFSPDNHTRGVQFEKLCKWLLENPIIACAHQHWACHIWTTLIPLKKAICKYKLRDFIPWKDNGDGADFKSNK